MFQFLRIVLLSAASLTIAGCSFLSAVGGASAVQLRGMQSISPVPAIDLELTNQAGQRMRLKDFQGKAVVMVRMDTDCTGDCAEMARGIAAVSGQMTSYNESDRVAFLAVSGAPQKDTVERADQLWGRLDMPGNAHFLTGSAEEVQQAWANFDMSGRAKGGGREVADLLLIDTRGKVRGYLTNPSFDPSDLRHNIRLLMSETNTLVAPICH